MFLQGSPSVSLENGFGHNLQHMPPFGITTTALCMVFQYATLICSNPGLILGPRDLDLGSNWAGDFCWQKRDPKNMTLWRKWSPWGLRGICRRGMDCRVPRRPFGKAISPQTLPENHFVGFSPFSEKSLGPPGPHAGFPIGSLKELLPILPPAAL